MMMTRPVIGITTCNTNGTLPNTLAGREYKTYRSALDNCGVETILIRMDTTDSEMESIYLKCGGFLLSGGDDVDPALYREKRSPLTKGIHRMQDDLEIKITRWAAANGRPLLGICRGCQVMNVAMGGSLYQHISDELPGALNHDQHKDVFGEKKSRRLLYHKVDVTADSLLERATQRAQLETNSLHHQGIKRIGGRLTASGIVHEDGLVEAIEITGHPFFLGVQWHPEELTEIPEHNRIFEAFTEACRK